MDWEAKETERKKEIEKERQRLLAMSDGEAESLPVPDRYQRIRYLREIEAHEWLQNLRRGIPEPIMTTVTKKSQRYFGSFKPRVIYERD